MSKKIRCNCCKTKINPLLKDMFRCKCENIYCRVHLYDHNCTYNYLEHQKNKLTKSLEKVEANKIDEL